MKNPIFTRLLVVVGIYVGLKYFGGAVGAKILYPINLLVTFLHELGHALGALITGGKVLKLEVAADGSGVTYTAGGNRGIILMGGYIGSAILGNLLFYIGAKWQKAAHVAIALLCATMVFSGFYWFSTMFSFGFSVAFAVGLYLISRFTSLDREILMFLGLASILYIIQDFRVGPSSDLEKYAELMVIFPKSVWMYLWLFIALLLCFLNLRLIFKKEKQVEVG
ncbi:MAG: M50 family metallopeptidase [Bacteroidota bacterium]